MAKGKGSNRSKTSKASVKVGDLKPKNDPKGGLNDMKVNTPANLGEITVTPSPMLNFTNTTFKK